VKRTAPAIIVAIVLWILSPSAALAAESSTPTLDVRVDVRADVLGTYVVTARAVAGARRRGGRLSPVVCSSPNGEHDPTHQGNPAARSDCPR